MRAIYPTLISQTGYREKQVRIAIDGNRRDGRRIANISRTCFSLKRRPR
jgi:hypothetical protein